MNEIGIIGANESAPSDQAAHGLTKLNRIIDQWQTQKRFVYYTEHTSYTFTTSRQSYTIGPTGNFVATRPTKIEGANVIRVSADPDERWPLQVIEVQDYAEIQIPAESGDEPSRLYYQPTVPNGTLWPWPFPENTAAALANKLELFTWVQLSAFVLDTNINLPPGYEDALTWTLAESLLPSYGKSSSPELEVQARRARGAIQTVNSKAPKIATQDLGMPSLHSYYLPEERDS